MTRKEVLEFLKEEGRAAPIREYNSLIDSLNSASNLLIYRNSIPEYSVVGESFAPLSLNTLLRWSERDWSRMYKKFKSDTSWFVVFVARGGFILMDTIENHIDEFPWTYIKPKTNIRSHEDESMFDTYTDEQLDQKMSKMRGKSLSILYIEDMIPDDYDDSNIEITNEIISAKAEEFDIEITERAVIALLTRTTSISGMPVYGTLISYQGGVILDWGNDRTDGFDFFDFSETKEYIDDL